MAVVAPLPSNEDQRLAALKQLEILDTAAEKVLDDLVRLAANICDAPISLISLIDERRQWFKASIGLDAKETARDIAFCSHAILSDETMIVEDASKDERFADNPLVTYDPNIRFYAGAPLTLNGEYNVGTLCVIDDQPRQLTDQQRDALEILRQSIMSQLELRRIERDLRHMEFLLPVCAWCRNVRTEDDGVESWQPLHEYVAKRERVSHSICPTCSAEAEREIDLM